jgi:hypothetical protein
MSGLKPNRIVEGYRGLAIIHSQSSEFLDAIIIPKSSNSVQSFGMTEISPPFFFKDVKGRFSLMSMVVWWDSSPFLKGGAGGILFSRLHGNYAAGFNPHGSNPATLIFLLSPIYSRFLHKW